MKDQVFRSSNAAAVFFADTPGAGGALADDGSLAILCKLQISVGKRKESLADKLLWPEV